jgi:hypothetical protein
MLNNVINIREALSFESEKKKEGDNGDVRVEEGIDVIASAKRCCSGHV